MRTLQVLRSILRVGLARLANKYDWQHEMARQCQQLGGVYIKFLQMLAVHSSTKHIVEKLGVDTAFEQVSYEYIDVGTELGALVEHFQFISAEPFAAGSYGQVYRATLRDGQDVVIKILRPSLKKTLKADLRLLRLIGRVSSWFMQSSMVDFYTMAREFSRATWAETNYRLEAQSGERIRAYYERYGTLVIPRSYMELTTRTALVQEYVGGVSISALEQKQSEGFRIDDMVRASVGSDVWTQLQTMGTEMLLATVYADYLMIDPHPGNVRLLPDNKVALLDFGLTARAPTNRSAFAELIHEMRMLYEDNFRAGSFAVAMLAYFDTELHDALEHIAQEKSDDYAVSLSGFIDRFVSSQTRQVQLQSYLSDKQLFQVFTQVLNQGNKLGIRISEENAFLQRSMSMFLSVIRSISDAHVEDVYAPIIRHCLTKVDDEIRTRGITQSSTHREISPERAFEVAANWLAAIAERDRKMYQFITTRRYA
ncbi:hypothetical protein CSA80_01655 [Candidatus Saccharibacteria bacterium]|nr:MAG: hypothetical protein CSA80_01655 [Candidatus Saccharibacteria bacterium]